MSAALEHDRSGAPGAGEPAPAASPQSGPAVRFTKLLRFHVEQLTPQDRQRSALLLKSSAYSSDLDELLKRSPAAEALLVGGEPVACAGLLDMRLGRARAWAIIGRGVPRPVWPAVVGRMRQQVDQALATPNDGGWAHRVEACTPLDWPNGHRLLSMLGFAFEAILAGDLEDGGHGALYARLSAKVKPLPNRYSAVMQIAARVTYEDVVAPNARGKAA